MSSPPRAITGAHIRIARPTTNIKALRNFYCKGLGFNVLYEFSGHEGFDGLIIGLEDSAAGYHLEFTTSKAVGREEAARAPPSEDNLLVFYLPEEEVWKQGVERLEAAGCESVKAFNPYWDRVGRTFEDPDGYRVVLQNAKWSNEEVARRWKELEGGQ